VAFHAGVVYVAEAGNRRVAAYDAATGEEITSPFDGLSLVEPFDLAAQADGVITLLDAGTGQLLRYEPEAGVINAIPLSPEAVNRSRGIGAGTKGEIWIANTPGQRIVAVDASGAILQEIVLPAVTTGETELQPVDVAAMPDNSLYVTDVAGHMLYRFSLAGYLISSQPIPVANSLDSAHLAVDAAGYLYMTEPEAGRVVKLDPAGVVERIWSVRTSETTDAKPVGIAVADDGSVWVADSQGGRLLRLTPEGDE
jgi:streptogramin lyase